MRLLLAMLITCSLHAFHFQRRPTAEDDKPATIKVLLNRDLEGTLLEVKGPFMVYNPHNGKKLSTGWRSKRYYIAPHKDGMKWGESYPGIFQIKVVPTSSETTVLIGGIQYRGAVELYTIDDKLTIINEVDVESYLKSILSPRFATEHPSAVMDSIAIIARTDAYYTALVNHDSFWHVDARDVGYNGYGLTAINPSVERAIESTRYLVMTYQEQPFAATWNKNCAGKTASFQSIFRKNTTAPSGVSATFAAQDREESRWALDIPTSEIATIACTNRVTGLDLFVDSSSNKVYAVKVKDGSRSKDIDFVTLQQALGEDRLFSNDFTVELKGQMLHFEGYGEGNGVGLCIYSATQMADKGDLAPNILSEFYPQTHLEKMRSYPHNVITASTDYFIAPRNKETHR